MSDTEQKINEIGEVSPTLSPTDDRWTAAYKRHEHQNSAKGFAHCEGPLAVEACSAAGACFDES